MIQTITRNYSTTPTTMEFYGETNEDLALMPTTTKPGEGKYSDIGLAPVMSVAKILTDDTLTMYMLRSNGWIKINPEDLEF